MGLLFILHFLNCYVCQCLCNYNNIYILIVNNQFESDEIYYFEGLYITLCLIANLNIPSVEITTVICIFILEFVIGVYFFVFLYSIFTIKNKLREK